MMIDNHAQNAYSTNLFWNSTFFIQNSTVFRPDWTLNSTLSFKEEDLLEIKKLDKDILLV